MVASDQGNQRGFADCVVVEAQSREFSEKGWMRKEGIAAIEDVFGFFIDFSVC